MAPLPGGRGAAEKLFLTYFAGNGGDRVPRGRRQLKFIIMRHLLTGAALALAAAAAVPAAADDDTRIVIYSSTGGQPVETAIGEVRKITFGDSSFAIIYNDAQMPATEMGYDDVRCIRFGSATTGIAAAGNDGNDIRLALEDGRLVVGGISGRTEIALYDMAGRRLYARTTTTDTVIPTDGMEKGVYILRANGKSFKFRKL